MPVATCAFSDRHRELVHLRHPVQPNRAAGALRLRERAIATSGIYFARTKNRRRCVSPILDGTHRPSRVRLYQRDRGRSELHDSRCTDESCVRAARRSRASTGAVFRGCVVARARRRPILDVSPNVRHVPPDLIRLRPFTDACSTACLRCFFLAARHGRIGMIWSRHPAISR